MNIHKNARLTFARRLEMVQDVLQRKLRPSAAAARHEVSVPTVRKWVGRYLVQGEPGLRDASSRPRVSPRAIAPHTALAIVELRRRFLTHARIADSLGVSQSTVGRTLARAGLSRWSDLTPSEPTVRYEHEHPGDLLHIDTKKLGRIVRMGHRVTGDPRDRVDGAGWEFLFVAVDDHARIGFTQIHPDECQASAVGFLRASRAYFAGLGVTVRRVLTDNGSAFRSKTFADTRASPARSLNTRQHRWPIVAPICTVGPSRPSAMPVPSANTPPMNLTGSTAARIGTTSPRIISSTRCTPLPEASGA